MKYFHNIVFNKNNIYKTFTNIDSNTTKICLQFYYRKLVYNYHLKVKKYINLSDRNHSSLRKWSSHRYESNLLEISRIQNALESWDNQNELSLEVHEFVFQVCSLYQF